MTGQYVSDIQPKSRKKYKRNHRARGERSVRLKNCGWHLEYNDSEGSWKSGKVCEKMTSASVRFARRLRLVQDL
jgi:hypothetical protein